MRHIITLAFCVIALFAKADIGETYDLRQQRKLLEIELKAMLSDSTVSQAEIASVYQQIVSVDSQIFASYDQTVDRLTKMQLSDTRNSQKLVWLALIASVISIVFAILLALGRNRLIENNETGFFTVYRQLSLEFFKRVSPVKAGASRMLRVNIVVVVGLLFMSASVIAFLLTKL